MLSVELALARNQGRKRGARSPRFRSQPVGPAAVRYLALRQTCSVRDGSRRRTACAPRWRASDCLRIPRIAPLRAASCSPICAARRKAACASSRARLPTTSCAAGSSSRQLAASVARSPHDCDSRCGSVAHALSESSRERCRCAASCSAFSEPRHCASAVSHVALLLPLSGAAAAAGIERARWIHDRALSGAGGAAPARSRVRHGGNQRCGSDCARTQEGAEFIVGPLMT